MKVSKRILALLLSVILAFSAVAVSASAAGVTTEVDEDGAQNNTTATATAVDDITVGAKGALANASDIDMFSFALKKDGFSKVTFTHDASGDATVYFKVSLWVFNGKNYNKVTSFEVKGNQATTESAVVATTAEKYIVRVDAGASCAPIDYTVKVTSETVSYKSETEPNNDADSANALTPNYTKTIGKDLVYGSLTAGDKDYYSFTLAEKGYISLNLFNGKKFGAANSDITFTVQQYSNDVNPQLLNISEYKLTSAEDTAYTPDVGLGAGTYFVKVSGSTGIYGVEVYAVKDATSEQEYNNTMATANLLTNGNNYYAAMNLASDRDFFKVDVTDKVASKITVAAVSSSFDGDLKVRIYKKTTSGDPIVTGKATKDAAFEYDLGTQGAGVYYVVVSPGATCPTKLYKISAVKSEVTKVGNDGDGMWARIWAQVKTMDWSQFAVYKELIGNIDMKTVMGYFTGTFIPIVQRLVKWFQENK